MTYAKRALKWMTCTFAAIIVAGCADEAPSPELRDRLNARLSTFSSGNDAALATFYAKRSYRPYWLADCSHLFPPGETCGARLIEQLRRAGTRGLDADDYRADELSARLKNLDSPDVRADLEIAFSQAYLRYAADLARGRLNPESAARGWLIPRPSFDPATALALVEELGPAEFVEATEPDSAEYRRLVKARPLMVRHVEHGGWPEVEYEGLIRPGERHAVVPALRSRLAVTGELDRRAAASANRSGEPDLYDEHTVQAVRDFQRRHGLEADGILGPEAKAMLNVSASERLAQIDLNLERLRWIGDTGGRRIRVNLASFRLQAIDDDKVRLDMPVIVGKAQTATPSFEDQIEYIEINPYWIVPQSIVANEIAPAAAQNPDYLREHDMELIDKTSGQGRPVDPRTVDWQRHAGRDVEFPYVVRQRPGAHNALGRIKFIFPNEHAIYLHDTPAAELFERADRTFSHGCIRVREPLDLATFLLADSKDWDGRRIRQAIDSDDTRRIDLTTRIPITLYYLTAWADPDRQALHFRPDVYERDRVLRHELAQLIPVHRRADATPGADRANLRAYDDRARNLQQP